MPDVETIEYRAAPISGTAKVTWFVSLGLTLLNLLGGLGFAIYASFFAPGLLVGFLITKILVCLFMAFCMIMLGGAAMLLSQALTIFVSFKGGIFWKR